MPLPYYLTLLCLVLSAPACESGAARSVATAPPPAADSLRPEPPTAAPGMVTDSTAAGDPAPAAAPAAQIDRVADSVPALPSYAYLTGQFEPADHPDFVRVAAGYTDGDPYFLHRETYASFREMHAAARADSVNLVIVSATRNFRRQKRIWEAKWSGERPIENGKRANEAYPEPADRARAILRYSSMPGTSRHHWGTDIDLNRLTNAYFAGGEGRRIYDWLVANGPTYGFCQPYTAKGPERPQGYEEEKWHWSYRPLADRLTDYAALHLDDGDIAGFAGAAAARPIGVVENYVLGVSPACREE